MSGCLVTTVLLLWVTVVKSVRHLDGAAFTRVLENLARDSLGTDEIQVIHAYTHTLIHKEYLNFSLF